LRAKCRAEVGGRGPRTAADGEGRGSDGPAREEGGRRALMRIGKGEGRGGRVMTCF